MSTSAAFAIIQDLAERAERGEEIMEEALTIGQPLSKRSDEARVIIGALASTIKKRYGENTVSKFADRIGWHSKSVYGYRRMVEFYGWQYLRETWLEDEDTPLRYTHFRDAMRLGETSTALNFLETCAVHMSPDEARRELTLMAGKPPAPATLFRGDVQVRSVDTERGTVTLFVADGVETLMNYRNQDVSITIKELSK